jgi:hypothetical protein
MYAGMLKSVCTMNTCTFYIYCMCAYMNKDSDGLLSRCELRAVLASFFTKHCHRTIQENATALSAALFSVLDPQKLGYIDSDGTNIYIKNMILHTLFFII